MQKILLNYQLVSNKKARELWAGLNISFYFINITTSLSLSDESVAQLAASGKGFYAMSGERLTEGINYTTEPFSISKREVVL